MWEVILKATLAVFMAGIGGLIVGAFAYLSRPKAFHKLSRKERKEILGLERALSGGLDPDFDIIEFGKDAINAIHGIHHDLTELDADVTDIAADVADAGKDTAHDEELLEVAAQTDSEEGTD